MRFYQERRTFTPDSMDKFDWSFTDEVMNEMRRWAST